MPIITAAGVATYSLEEKAEPYSSLGELTLNLDTSNIFTVSLTESISQYNYK